MPVLLQSRLGGEYFSAFTPKGVVLAWLGFGSKSRVRQIYFEVKSEYSSFIPE